MYINGFCAQIVCPKMGSNEKFRWVADELFSSALSFTFIVLNSPDKEEKQCPNQ